MELELATTEDIINELKNRQIRFVFVGVENTNTRRNNVACLAGQGASTEDLLNLIHMSQEALVRLDDDESRGE